MLCCDEGGAGMCCDEGGAVMCCAVMKVEQ